MDRTYIDSQSSSFYNDLLRKCMGRGHKIPKYLFNPRITEEWKEGGTLIVGINHWCIQKGCEFYEDCVLNSNSKKYDKLCRWAVSEVDETIKYDLRYTTYEAFNCYFGDFLGYESFKEFLLYITGTQDCMEPDEQRKYWNHLAFYNYIQHFTKMSLTHTSMYGVKDALIKKEDEDFKAFLEVLCDLKPRLVIVWHKEIKDLLLRKITERKLPKGRKLQLVDDLGIPTKSMFRFVYDEKKLHKSETEFIQFTEKFKQKYGCIGDFSTEQVVLRLLRWNMFKTEEDLSLLTQLSVLSDDLKNMLDSVEDFSWDSGVLVFLVRRIQEQLGITAILEKVPYTILHYKEDDIVYSNVLLRPKVNMQVRPLVGIYPQDCSHYSLKKYEEKDLLALSGFSFDGLRSKTYIEEKVLAQGYIVYIDEYHPVSEAFFKHLFDGKLDKGSFSMIIMKSSEENDNRYLGILKDSNRICEIRSTAIGNEAYLFLKLFNEPKDNSQVIIEGKKRRISNRKLASLIPLKLNDNSSDKVELDNKGTETGTQLLAMKKQIKQLIEEKIEANQNIVGQLTNVINNAYRCGLLSIKPNKTIVYKKSFGRIACYNLYCRGVYDKILSKSKGKRVEVMKSLFGRMCVDSYHKTKKDLENSGFKTQVKIIELCFKTLKKADFEANLERIKKHELINN